MTCECKCKNIPGTESPCPPGSKLQSSAPDCTCACNPKDIEYYDDCRCQGTYGFKCPNGQKFNSDCACECIDQDDQDKVLCIETKECVDNPCGGEGQEWDPVKCECYCKQVSGAPAKELCNGECKELCLLPEERNQENCECECKNGGQVCRDLLGQASCVKCPHGYNSDCECTCPNVTFGNQVYQGSYDANAEDCLYNITCWECGDEGNCIPRFATGLPLSRINSQGSDCSNYPSIAGKTRFNSCAEAEEDC